MTQETRERRRRRTKKVTVRARPGTAKPIRPQVVTLTDEIYRVVWHCEDLARGATLVIAFREDPRGPFFLLEFAESYVIGYGNRGPEDTSRTYEYVARSLKNGRTTHLGEGSLKNFAQEPITAPSEPPLGPPWQENSLIGETGGGGDEEGKKDEGGGAVDEGP